MKFATLLLLAFAVASVTLATTAPAQAEEAVTSTSEAETGSGRRNWSAAFDLESGQSWRAKGPQKIEHGISFDGGWRLKEVWRAGFYSEADLSTSSGERGFLDTELSFTRTGLRFGSFTELELGVFSILPTDGAERKVGLITAPGISALWDSKPFSFLSVVFETRALRYIRDRDTAEKIVGRTFDEEGEIDEPGEAAAAGSDKWRLENTLKFGHEFAGNWRVQAKAKVAESWKWVSGREQDVGFEQKVIYGWGQAELGFGHRNVTKTLSRNAERKAVALFRPEESRLFGTLSFTM